MRDLINLVEKYLDAQYAPLYHSTTLHNAFTIMKDGFIKSFMSDKAISLTRNANLWYGNNTAGLGDIQFVVDQEQLRSRYKTTPYNYFDGYSNEKTDPNAVERRAEAEEQIKKPIPINTRFITKILIAKQTVDSILNPTEFTQYGNVKKQMLEFVVDQAKKKNIPIEYVNRPTPQFA